MDACLAGQRAATSQSGRGTHAIPGVRPGRGPTRLWLVVAVAHQWYGYLKTAIKPVVWTTPSRLSVQWSRCSVIGRPVVPSPRTPTRSLPRSMASSSRRWDISSEA
jgi:hypothetical protein